MASTIVDFMSEQPSGMWSSDIQNLWLSHLNIIKNKPVTLVGLSRHQCGKYHADFYGLLSELGVASHYHPFVTAFNGFSHPTQYQSTQESVMLPDFQELNLIAQINRVSNV